MTTTANHPHSVPTSDRPGGAAMPPARQKTGAGSVGLVGPLMALLLIGLGAILLRDAIAMVGNDRSRTWIAAALRGLDGLTAEWWMIPLGAAVALVGVWLIVSAVRPRSRKTLAVTSQTGIFLRTVDIARLASAAAADVDGVLAATSAASRRKVTVTAESDRDRVAELVRAAVTDRLSCLQKPLPIKIRVRPTRHQRPGGN